MPLLNDESGLAQFRESAAGGSLAHAELRR
jgi:hypothetical protein